MRAGVHTGECELRDDEVAGVAVHIGARIADLAGPGEVLVSSTVRELASGGLFGFEDRGLHALRGVPGTWRLYAAGEPTAGELRPDALRLAQAPAAAAAAARDRAADRLRRAARAAHGDRSGMVRRA